MYFTDSIQNVNGLHSRLKQWIDCFKGVATKYLDNYVAWFLFVDSLTSFVFEMTDTYIAYGYLNSLSNPYSTGQ